MTTNENLSKLLDLNVNKMTEKKNGLTYLSWANAWKEFLKIYPDATYNILKDDNGNCHFGDNQNGYMVYTIVTADSITREMWLPVMDFKNKSMMQPTTFDINKAVMRCLTKNLAMFGLGLYIYAGEDLPEDAETTVEQLNDNTLFIGPTQVKHIEKLIAYKGVELDKVLASYKVEHLSSMTYAMYENAVAKLEKTKRVKADES